MARPESLYHNYYSSYVDPADTMLRPNNLRSKSTYNINQPAPTSAAKFGSRLERLSQSTNYVISVDCFDRWTLAQTESSELLQKKQEDLHNTYYNNMVMYINNKNSDTDSTVSGIKVTGSLLLSSVF